jgi:adenylate cyclase
MVPGPLGSDAFERALAAERLRNARVLNLVRFAGVSLFLVLVVGLILLENAAAGRGYWGLLGAYWLLSALVLLGSRLSSRWAKLSLLAIPFLDMPLVFLIQHQHMMQVPTPLAVANFTLAIYVCLVMLAAMSLQRWQVAFAAVIAAALEVWLQQAARETTLGRVGAVLLLALAWAICEYARARRISMVNRICEEQLRRERLGRYFSPQVAAQIEDQAESYAAGQQCEISILFADIRGFTALSERLESGQLVGLLNEFHRRMVEAVFAQGGTLDKYMGDGVMAYFGAPLSQSDHSERALRCALAMQSQLVEINHDRTERGEAPLRMGIGIHTGPAVVGSIGAPHRREFTAVGDSVNLASRLEELTKFFDEPIIVSEETRQRAQTAFGFRPLEPVEVRGKSALVRTYALVVPLSAPPG